MTKSELVNELARIRKKLSHMENMKDRFRALELKLREQTIEYEKLSALGRLTANVAHEIRNPITVIGGLARRIVKALPSDRKERKYLKLIVLESKRLEDILKDAITYSDKGVFHRSECDINEVVDDALMLYSNRCEQLCINVQKSFGKVPIVYIDRKHVGEAIANIIHNAVDALQEGGTVLVKTGKRKFNKKSYVVVLVADTGRGIPQDLMKLIFEPFFTTKFNQRDTGLGLPIAKKIVEAHGGFIRAESKVGKGTTFSLYFPYRISSQRG